MFQRDGRLLPDSADDCKQCSQQCQGLGYCPGFKPTAAAARADLIKKVRAVIEAQQALLQSLENLCKVEEA